MALDAFGRLRTSENFTTFNYYPSLLSNNTTLDIDVFVSRQNGGAQTYDSQNFINMPINGSGDTYSLRTTKQPMIYQPGKSRLIFMTGVLMATIPPTATTTSRMGLFSVDSATPPVVTAGTYLKCNGVNLFWEDVTQKTVDPITTVIQSSWNIDTFNGTGPSGKTLTIANAAETLLIVIDQEWLGVGRIRCGFIIDGVIYYGHQFLHNGFTVQYTKTPRLNLSYYISGTTANSMRQMCCTNIIESGYFTTGRINNISVPISNFVSLNGTNDRVILGIQINSAYPNATFFINYLNFYYTGGASKYSQYKIQLFSTNGPIGVLSATPTFTSLPNSAVQYFYGAGGINVTTPGFIIGSGYLDVSSSINIALSEFASLQTRQLFTQYDTLYITGISNDGGTMGVSVIFVEDI
jgi:hypothetical protein